MNKQLNKLLKIKDEGYNAAHNDKGMDCPYSKDSEEESYWLSGYNEYLDGYSRSFDI